MQQYPQLTAKELHLANKALYDRETGKLEQMYFDAVDTWKVLWRMWKGTGFKDREVMLAYERQCKLMNNLGKMLYS